MFWTGGFGMNCPYLMFWLGVSRRKGPRMLTKSRVKPEVIAACKLSTPIDRLKHECALHIQPFSTHWAGGGSFYVNAGGVKIRIADHSNVSAYQEEPDFNILRSEGVSIAETLNEWANLNPEEFGRLLDMVYYPSTAKKVVFAKHVGLTAPKLKKALADHPECYEEICENRAYPNTYTEVIDCYSALEVLEEAGITERLPIYFGQHTEEDYDGR